MEWAKFGAEVGIGVLKIVVDSRTNSELVQANCERDMYKQEVDRLNARLDRIVTPRNSNGNRSIQGNKSGYKKGESSGSKGFSKSTTLNPCSQGKSLVEPKYQGKNMAGQETHPHSKNSGAFYSSGGNNGKSQPNAFGVNSSHGKGNMQKKGQGRGRGSTRN